MINTEKTEYMYLNQSSSNKISSSSEEDIKRNISETMFPPQTRALMKDWPIVGRPTLLISTEFYEYDFIHRIFIIAYDIFGSGLLTGILYGFGFGMDNGGICYGNFT